MPSRPETLDHDAICRLLPHAGAMCLLDSVEAWSDDAIHCRADSHRDPANPLRGEGGLHALGALEYGAQGMAVHGALLADGGPPRAGYLAAVRNLQLQVQRLDGLDDPLEIHAERILSDTHSSIYDLRVTAGDRPVLSARATVILQPADEEKTP
ncbi:hypothetical protein TVD_11565 [Thioalkalivibrio versutus]|uniref:3-hydroxylacyl-ACP dehydratase n=1 Tax=Thioalkalivibrio versutus TaxID=106634 RepID=A0A0G3G8R0_9GAMM|nr:hypothetical protein [Thioalkalivibrio versutus]AKJ95952.1 hypothetical protein TVD_11565 [Thioalkalivibrio versutus]